MPEFDSESSLAEKGFGKGSRWRTEADPKDYKERFGLENCIKTHLSALELETLVSQNKVRQAQPSKTFNPKLSKIC